MNATSPPPALLEGLAAMHSAHVRPNLVPERTSLQLAGLPLLSSADRAKGFEPSHSALKPEAADAPSTAGLCPCTAVIRQQLPMKVPSAVWRASSSSKTICEANSGCCHRARLPLAIIWGLHAHSYTPSPAGSTPQLQHLLHEPFNT